MTHDRLMSVVYGSWFAVRRSRLVSDLFFGFSVVDGVLLAGMYVLGTYLVVDMPIQLVFLGLGISASAEAARGWRASAGLFAIVVLSLMVAATAVAIPLVPRYGPVSLNLRVLHALAGKYFLLGFLPLLWRHLHREWLVPDRLSKISAQFGWLFLKLSLWAGAFMALLVIKGQLIRWHVGLLAVATPLVAVHAFLAAKRSRAHRPDTVSVARWLTDRTSWSGLGASALVAGSLTIAFVLLVPQQGEGVFNLPAPEAERAVAGVTDLQPSPARLLDAHFTRSQFLGQSAGCGVSPCHPIKLEQWKGSAHRNSVTPAYRREFEAAIKAHGAPFGRLCAGCHDPISLFSGQVDFSRPLISPDSEREGISCLVCHRLTTRVSVPANGAVAFRFPEYYGRIPAFPFSMVFFWTEHVSDFAAVDSPDDRVCIACHRFQPLAGDGNLPEAANWMAAEYHQQRRMIAPCRGDCGCIACHMPARMQSEKPAGKRADHRFASALAADALREACATRSATR